MEDEELEKTKSLNDLSDLIAKDTEDYLPDDSSLEDDILDEMEPTRETLYNTIVETKQEDSNLNNDDKKPNLIDRFKGLSKKNKIIIIVSFVVVFIASIIITVLILSKSKKPVIVEEEPQEEALVIDNGNYRYSNGTLTFLNESDTEIGTYECNNKSEDLCYVAYLNNSEDDFDVTQNIYEDNSLVKLRSQIYNNRYVFIVDQSENTNDVIYLYDMLEKKQISEVLGIKAYNLDNNYVILKNKDKKYGLFDITSNEIKPVIDYSYSYMGIIKKDDNKYIVVKNNKGYYLVDYNNKFISKVSTNSIYDYNDNYIVVKNNNLYNVISYEGDELLTGFDYIKLINDQYLSVVVNNNLYIRNYSNNKFNESGYRLNNNNYRQVNTYNSENILVSSSYAYKVNINENMATLFINNDKETEEVGLNLLDGEASSLKNYISYFDGVLYFYSDIEKTSLIGSYTCTNKNNFSSSNEFSHCMIASDSYINNNFKNYRLNNDTNIIPIINNRFVFINDSLDTNSKDIKLYDFTNNKVMASYGLVSYDSNNSDISIDTISSKNIIVKNKNNKFGMINLSNNGISKIYDFIYDAMENIGDYTLVKQNNKWKLLFSSDESSVSFDNKIYDYNNDYYVVSDNNGYRLYKSDGSLVNDTTMKYIKLLGDTCYLYVLDNKVYVSSYDNNVLLDNISIDAVDNDLKYINMLKLTKLGSDTVVLEILDESGKKVNSYNINISNSNGEE